MMFLSIWYRLTSSTSSIPLNSIISLTNVSLNSLLSTVLSFPSATIIGNFSYTVGFVPESNASVSFPDQYRRTLSSTWERFDLNLASTPLSIIPPSPSTNPKVTPAKIIKIIIVITSATRVIPLFP